MRQREVFGKLCVSPHRYAIIEKFLQCFHDVASLGPQMKIFGFQAGGSEKWNLRKINFEAMKNLREIDFFVGVLVAMEML